MQCSSFLRNTTEEAMRRSERWHKKSFSVSERCSLDPNHLFSSQLPPPFKKKRKKVWQLEQVQFCVVLSRCFPLPFVAKCRSSLLTLPGAHPVCEIFDMRIVTLCSDEMTMIHSFWNVLYILFIWFDFVYSLLTNGMHHYFWLILGLGQFRILILRVIIIQHS